MAKHVYHYHAEFQVAPGVVHSIDGIALLRTKIEDMVDYKSLKASVAALSDIEVSSEDIVIASLSYLGEGD